LAKGKNLSYFPSGLMVQFTNSLLFSSTHICWIYFNNCILRFHFSRLAKWLKW
jgi:hypothetical protein